MATNDIPEPTGTASARTQALSDAGVSIWLDDLSRERLDTGNLAQLVATRNVVGITTNPTIFAASIGGSSAYDDQLAALASQGVSTDDAVWALTTQDVRNAADVLRETFEATDGVDGRVSIEVDPRLAHDADATASLAATLWSTIDRPNIFIKIPATVEGLTAISDTLAQGVSVNVTLIFSLERYRAVIDAFATGLERAVAAGQDVSRLASVASFFVSRVDTAVDPLLEEIGSEEALALRGTVAVANARQAYAIHEQFLASDRWSALAAAGARPQRPLWASTGVKNPDYADTLYVSELVAPGVVNTMPEKTLEAVADHGEVTGDTVRPAEAEAAHLLASLPVIGVDLDAVTQQLEDEGVDKFVKSWEQLVQTVADGLDQAGAEAPAPKENA